MTCFKIAKMNLSSWKKFKVKSGMFDKYLINH